jgi:predicted CoA-binding protein
MTSATDDATIRQVLEHVRTIAIVGASDRTNRPAHGVMGFLQSRGYRCRPVNPRLAGQLLLGEIVSATLTDVEPAPDMVDIFRDPAHVGPIVDEAIAIGARVVWMQLGVVNEAAARRARDAGLTVVMDRCPAIEIPRLGITGPTA